jgi:hypothetical protein
VYGSFIDYNTGDILKGQEYWKPLSNFIIEYADHPEAKFKGETGVLQRRHLKPKSVVYIGKETKGLGMHYFGEPMVLSYYDWKKSKDPFLR